jgi:hypothetical protein
MIRVIRKPILEGKKVNKMTHGSYIVKRYILNGRVSEEEEERRWGRVRYY